MMLGDVLKRLTDDAAAAEVILDIGDLSMLHAMRERAEAEGVDLATFSRGAVRRYSAEASDEEWVTMLGLVTRSDDPGMTCLRRAFDNAIGASQTHGHHHHAPRNGSSDLSNASGLSSGT